MQQDEFGIYDIYTFIHIPFWQKMWFKGTLFCLAMVSIGLFMWWLMSLFLFSKKRKDVPLKQIVLQQLERARQVHAQENMQKLYADLGLVLRLFFTDTHGNDMVSLTEHEMIQHISDCALCNEYGHADQHHCPVCVTSPLLISNWHQEIKRLLEQMSNVKYNTEIVMRDESVTNDINVVTILVHSIYFKK